MKSMGYILLLVLAGAAGAATVTKTTTVKATVKAPVVVSKTVVPAKQAVTVVKKAATVKPSSVTIDGGVVQRPGYGWSATFELKAGQTLRVYVEDAKGVRTSEASFVLAPRHKTMQGRVSIGGVPK
jgi:hypothetical protein